MSRAAAFRFLCDCLSSILSNRPPRSGLTADFRWTTFIALAHEYRVSFAVASTMEGLSPSESPSKEIRAFFSGIANHNRQRNERIRREATDVAKIMNGIGVTPIFMKGGGHLLTGLYPDVAIRHMADVDVLVPTTRVDECVNVLLACGFTQLTSYQHPRSHHHPPLGRSDLPVPIELHHSALAYPDCDFMTSDEIHSASQPLSIDGVRIAVPSPTHSAIHNIAHAQLSDHDCLYGRVNLRGLIDLALLSNIHADRVDWDLIRQRFIKAGHRNALEYHIQWARRLGAVIPSFRFSHASKLLFRRASYQVSRPKLLSLNIRLLRPLVLLRRELSDAALRRRLAHNILSWDWWRRHLRMLTTT